jgi:hypothetical protein
VFPYTYTLVPESAQLFNVGSVAIAVALNFGSPKWSIRLGYVTASGATVPEATINKDRNSLVRKKEIRSAGKLGDVGFPAADASSY